MLLFVEQGFSPTFVKLKGIENANQNNLTTFFSFHSSTFKKIRDSRQCDTFVHCGSSMRADIFYPKKSIGTYLKSFSTNPSVYRNRPNLTSLLTLFTVGLSLSSANLLWRGVRIKCKKCYAVFGVRRRRRKLADPSANGRAIITKFYVRWSV